VIEIFPKDLIEKYQIKPDETSSTKDIQAYTMNT
jgi:hypothetical protein